MVAVMIIVGDEPLDAGVEIALWEEVLEGSMPSFGLSLRLRVVRRTADMIHALSLSHSASSPET